MAPVPRDLFKLLLRVPRSLAFGDRGMEANNLPTGGHITMQNAFSYDSTSQPLR